MKDIAGAEAALFESIERTARDVFARFGFEEIRTPILEEKEVFTRALGEQTDVVQKEMYEFVDRSKTTVAMRPEGTAGVVRAYLENHLDKNPAPAKLFYAGPMFRSERPQAGRLRQFHQIGVEVLGTSSPHADAETILCLAAFLEAVGASGYQIKLNNLGTLEERDRYRALLENHFKPLSSQLCPDCLQRLSKNVFRLLDCKNETCKTLARQAPSISGVLTEESKAHFETVEADLKSAGRSYLIDPYLVRGLDYYTKTVFELTHPKLGAQDALAAGGRYDKLIETFGGSASGAVGFAVGVERLAACIDAQGPGKTVDLFIATLGDKAFGEGFKLLDRMRRSGLKAEMDFSSKSLKAQMRTADRFKSRFVAILGEDEIAKGTLVLKTMADGSQADVSLAGAVDELKGKIF